MEKPYIEIHATNFLTQTEHLSAEELGVYFKLYCHKIIRGALPHDEQELLKLVNCDSKTLHSIWPLLKDSE